MISIFYYKFLNLYFFNFELIFTAENEFAAAAYLCYFHVHQTKSVNPLHHSKSCHFDEDCLRIK